MKDEILIVGCGALATYFAARLSAAGTEVTILGKWRQALSALKQDGASLEGLGSFPVSVIDHPEGYEFSTALVLVKCWQTPNAARDLAACLDKGGIAITLQNGLGNDLCLGKVLGTDRVGRGVTTLGVTLVSPGVVRLGGDGTVTLENDDRISYLAEKLRVAKLKISTVDDIDPLIWGKLVINSALNPISAVLGEKNGDLPGNPHAVSLMTALAHESANVAKASGIELPYANPMEAVIETARRTSHNISSMLQDIRRGIRTEVDFINGAVVQHGDQVRVPTPCNQVMVSLVNAMTYNKGM